MAEPTLPARGGRTELSAGAGLSSREPLTLAVLALREAESHVPLIRFAGSDAATGAMERAFSYLTEYLSAPAPPPPEDREIALSLTEALTRLGERIAEEGRTLASWRAGLANAGAFPDSYSAQAEPSPITPQASFRVSA